MASSDTFSRWVLREQREDAVRVVGRDRQPVLRRQVAVHDRGLGALGGVVDRVRVLEPGGVARQLREPGIAHRVEPVLLVDQRVRRAARRAAPPRSAPASRRRPCAPRPRRGRRAWRPASRTGTAAGTPAATGVSTLRNERTGSARATAAPAPPRSPPRGRSAPRPRRRIAFFSACAAMSATSAPRARSARSAGTARPARPTAARSPAAASGGSTTSRTEKEMMSKPDEPRAAKNSGLSPSRSKSGWATAKVQSTARFRGARAPPWQWLGAAGSAAAGFGGGSSALRPGVVQHPGARLEPLASARPRTPRPAQRSKKPSS